MMDSGSTVDVANCEEAFPLHTIVSSKAQRNGVVYTNASGGGIENEGEIEIVHLDEDGHEVPLTIQHAKVHCPILSVRRWAKRGSIISFRKGGGLIKMPDGRLMPFVEKHGVYFIRLRVRRPDAGTPMDVCGLSSVQKSSQLFSRPAV